MCYGYLCHVSTHMSSVLVYGDNVANVKVPQVRSCLCSLLRQRQKLNIFSSYTSTIHVKTFKSASSLVLYFDFTSLSSCNKLTHNEPKSLPHEPFTARMADSFTQDTHIHIHQWKKYFLLNRACIESAKK